MADALQIQVFDGHNDALFRLFRDSRPAAETRFLDGDDQGHIDLPRARAGGLAGGLFAIFAPSASSEKLAELMQGDSYDVPLPGELRVDVAQAATIVMISILNRLERELNGALAICRDVPAIRKAMKRGAMATVLHIEGAEAIDRDFRLLDLLYAAGLRSIGIVWSRPNIFGHGVPLPLPGLARYRPRPDRPRQGAGQGLQQARYPDRPVASQRAGVLGRCLDLDRAARRHPLERPRHLSDPAQSDREAARCHP